MMKKNVLSFLLAAIMIISFPNIISVSAASEDFEYVQMVLEQLGIVDGGLFCEPDAKINKADFAVLSARLRGFDGDTAHKTSFIDIDKSYYAAACIEYLESLNVFDGYDDFDFHGEENITYSEAAGILVNLLEYGKIAATSNDRKVSNIRIAAELDINNGVGAGIDEELMQKQAIQMIYNALDAEICSMELSSGTDVKIVTDSGKTPMSEWLNLEKTTGLVTSVGKAAISHDGFTNNTLTINGKKYINGNFDAEYALGYFCEVYYYDADSSNFDTIAAAAVLPKKNDITVIKTNKIISFEDGILNYETEKSSARVKITNKDEVSLNGEPVPAEKRTEALLNSDGEIIVNKLQTGEVIVMISSYETYVVSAVYKDDLVICGRYDKKLDIDENADIQVYNSDKTESSFNDIAFGNVISVKTNSDNSLVKIYKSEAAAEEKFYGVTEEDDIQYYTIGDNKYEVTPECREFAQIPTVGTNIIAYLDIFGRVAYTAITDSDFIYGFLCKIVPDEIEDNIYIIKLYNVDGRFVKYYTDDKVNVDGTKAKDNLITLVERGNDDVNTYQLIRYKLNKENKISAIDTVYRGANENENSLRIIHRGYSAAGKEQSALVYKPENNLGAKVLIQGDTKFMSVPTAYTADEKLFNINRPQYVNGISYYVNAYCSASDKLTPEVVVQYSNSENVKHDNKFGVIRQIENVINSEDENVFKIIAGTEDGIAAEYLTKYDYMLDDIKDGSGAAHKLAKGDFVDISLNTLGNVIGIQLLYDAENNDWISDGVYGSFHGDNLYFGTAYRRNGSLLQIAVDGAALGKDETKFSEMLYNFNAAAAKVLLYSKKSDRVTESELNDICAYSDGASAASKLLIFADQADTRVVVIYK